MMSVKRKAVIGSVCVFVLAVMLIGVSGITNQASGKVNEKDFLSMDGGKIIFANKRSAATCTHNPAQDVPAGVRSHGDPVEKPGDKKGDTDSFSTVSQDSWVFQAVKDLAASEMPSLEEELEAEKPVTRYELAVVLARVLEKLRGARAVIEGPLSKVATLEKLSREFSRELDMLGIKEARFAARLGKLESKVDTLALAVHSMKKERQGLARRSEAAVASARSAQVMVNELKKRLDRFNAKFDRIEKYSDKIDGSERRLRKMSEILSRVLVKVALNDTKLQDLTKGEVSVGRRDVATMARAIAGLQKKLAKLTEEQVKLQENSESRITRGAGRNSTPQSYAALDAKSVRILNELVSRLQKKVAKNEKTVEELKAKKFTVKAPPRKVNSEALAEVKGLLKGFLKTFDSRLASVERKVL